MPHCERLKFNIGGHVKEVYLSVRKLLLVAPFAFASMGLIPLRISAAAESPDQIKREILKLEDVQSQAMLKGDVDTLSHILRQRDRLDPAGRRAADEGSGPRQPPQQQAEIRLNQTLRPPDPHLWKHGRPHRAESFDGPYGNKVFDFPRRFTNVYVRENGQWKLVVHHVTKVSKKVGEK